MTRLRCVHLNDDFAMGGVVKGLRIYDHPDLTRMVDSRVRPVNPRGRMAPRLNAHVIVTHFPPSWSSLPFLASLRLRNPHARLIHIEHSYTGNWEARTVRSQARFRLMLKLAYRMYDEVVAVSNGQAGWLRAIEAVDPVKLKVLHPWSGSQGLDKLPGPKFSQGQPIRLGAIGRFDHVKGFDVLIEAMKALPASRFELVIGGFGDQEQALRKAAGDMANIAFAGRIEDVASFYARCDVVVVPSRCEAFGQVAAEARMAGRPVIVSQADGLPEQVGRAGIVVDCSDPAMLASALAGLSTAQLKEMSVAARMSMAGAEFSRIKAWQALFHRAGKALAGRKSRSESLSGTLAISA
ncbi:hypothetical protein GCM10009127_26390 [Alteraurantiacibacter aestuarii]|nr:glycosyltransferase family 4 protein [Alteraurantiacibacter aestuarii]